MECPFCTRIDSRVLESRSTDDSRSIRRRRECSNCLKRFTTYERVEHIPMIVIKSGGSREVFSRDKLVSSIVRSCSKSQISALTIDEIVDDVESKMYKTARREINSTALGSLVMDSLKAADPVAYIRYASIFKKFSSIAEFIDEFKEIDDEALGIQFETLDHEVV